MAGRGALQEKSRIEIDPYRAIIFPNHLRHLRREGGFPKLLGLAQKIPEIPYIRLSKIERGEVIPRPDELVRIAGELGVAPGDLLLDIDDPGFDIGAWVAAGQQLRPVDDEAAAFAVKLAAALRFRRMSDPALTIGRIEEEYGIAPVILSRVENAHKTFDRWNPATIASLLRLFGAADRDALRSMTEGLHERGVLDARIRELSGAAPRIARTRAKIAELRDSLADASKDPPLRNPPERALPKPPTHEQRVLPVFGVPLDDGLLALTPTGELADAPRNAGPRAYALRVHRPTLGAALPGSATVIVDPDRFPGGMGIAALREGDAVRLLTVTFDRNGAMIGYSANPDRELPLDTVPPNDIAGVIAAYFA
ncbi:helix-turn-helix domain-containing protein [Allosphingosinicella deserti]|uniref:HTH cro/C1-type domain-containing protein n=1 Tax=Allosphingosinicella deserti TaxID=2116704 RepID=A0A2P7QVH4_9SPHN|nr:helix-turn-helix transcriptional regulator [Sphingomonas deserti]PSJ41944.1 hypothetical protein C7I55_06690 [Sphingomonas deserti]